jgi:hypothetical protein
MFLFNDAGVEGMVFLNDSLFNLKTYLKLLVGIQKFFKCDSIVSFLSLLARIEGECVQPIIGRCSKLAATE